MRVQVSWDYDSNDDYAPLIVDVPVEVFAEYDPTGDDSIADYLTDHYYFCVRGWRIA